MHINTILDIGVILMAATFGSAIIRYASLPKITSYILTGILIGPSVLNIISPGLMESSDLFTNIALSFVAFDLGSKFSMDKLSKTGKNISLIAVFQLVITFILVTLSIFLIMNKSFHIAMIYGAIACTTAPAAVILVVKSSKAEGEFTDTLLGIVALDDGLGIIVFALIFAIAGNVAGTYGSQDSVVFGLLHSFREIFGALLLGTTLGWVLCHMPKVVKISKDLMIYTLGIILFNAGLCIHFNFSVLLASMALGITVENLSETNIRFFHAVEKIESPFYVLFFVLAGAHLRIEMLTSISFLGLVYLVFRFGGKVLGAYIGALAIQANQKIKNFMGLALMPQAGVALGFALVVKSAFPAHGQEIFFVITATTVFFEIFGPVLTKKSLQAAGEIKSRNTL